MGCGIYFLDKMTEFWTTRKKRVCLMGYHHFFTFMLMINASTTAYSQYDEEILFEVFERVFITCDKQCAFLFDTHFNQIISGIVLSPFSKFRQKVDASLFRHLISELCHDDIQFCRLRMACTGTRLKIVVHPNSFLSQFSKASSQKSVTHTYIHKTEEW